MPKLVISALAVAVPVLSTCASVALSAAPTSLPSTPAWVEAEESAVLPSASTLWLLAPPSAEADAPPPSPPAVECDEESVAPPPALE